MQIQYTILSSILPIVEYKKDLIRNINKVLIEIQSQEGFEKIILGKSIGSDGIAKADQIRFQAQIQTLPPNCLDLIQRFHRVAFRSIGH